jgi:non-lysosomal glucosylceramidase
MPSSAHRLVLSAPAYLGTKTREISFPLGGIGTGCVGLAGNGRLIDWEIYNKPSKGSLNGISHFAVRAEKKGKILDARLVQGDLQPPFTGELTQKWFFEGFGFGPRRENLAGMPHFRHHEFKGEFPFAQLQFLDPLFPGGVRLFAFNPLIPGNERESGLPAAFFEIELTNTTSETIDYTVVGLLSNPAGQTQPVNEIRKSKGLTFLRLASSGIDPASPLYGELVLGTDTVEPSFQEYLYRGIWCDDLENYWNDLNQPGRFVNRTYPRGGKNGCWGLVDSGLLAGHFTVKPGASHSVRFLLAWHYPNLTNDWDPEADRRAAKAKLKNSWRNWYATEWKDAAAVAEYAFGHWERMLSETCLFHDALYRTTVPPVVLEAISANLSILKSPTVWRLEDGTFYGWEGVGIKAGSCEGSCTHVWNYAQALPFLFPRLERSMREANYAYNIDEEGGSHFRIRLPLGLKHDSSSFRPCADGQFGDVLKTYRDWKICGDTAWLKSLWPRLRKTIEFAWSPANLDRWDPGKTGVLWGRQHHTLDMELFGPNSWLTGYYLAALKAAAEMAPQVDDVDFGHTCAELFARGKSWVEEHLFNGEYYGQSIDLQNRSLLEKFNLGPRETGIFAGSVLDIYWNQEQGEIKYQLGEGCVIDAVVAQWHANLYGLGEIFHPKRVKKTLQAIFKYNFHTMRQTANPWRIFTLNDEKGVAICAWPEEKIRPKIPLPYSQETMDGLEYAAACLMIQAGLVKEGLSCVRAVRHRYDGENRNPWNEIECGSNYSRAMASYSLLNAFSGFQFDLTKARIGFAPLENPFRCFWALGSGWGEFEIDSAGATLRVLKGSLLLKEIVLPFRAIRVKAAVGLVPFDLENAVLCFQEALELTAGASLHFGSNSEEVRDPSKKQKKR